LHLISHLSRHNSPPTPTSLKHYSQLSIWLEKEKVEKELSVLLVVNRSLLLSLVVAVIKVLKPDLRKLVFR
jgi:hypothetical protein